MKNLFFILCFVSFNLLAQTDITLEVDGPSDLTPVGHGTYRATKNSFFCKEFSWNDGSPRRVLKTKYVEFDSNGSKLSIPAKIKGKCKYKRVKGSVGFEINGFAKSYNTLDISTGQNSNENQLKCKQIMSGPGSNTPMIHCMDQVIRVDHSGNGSIFVELR